MNGYDPDFLGGGLRVGLPSFNRSLGQSVLRKPQKLREGIYSDHLHFTLVMNEHTRQLIYSAYNIDQDAFKKSPPGGGKRTWRKDGDIGAENQLGNEYYKDRKNAAGDTIPNPYDKGHMVMRFNNMWGKTSAEADRAGKATFIYANASLQHENLNRDEWRELELDIVRNFQHDQDNRLTVFTGPIYGDLDRHINLTNQDSARVPSGFFKVICYRTKHDDPAEKLGVLAFAMFQDAKVLRDKRGRATVKTDRRYQVTISELQNWTGIKFGKKLYERNPLFYHQLSGTKAGISPRSLPERIPINHEEDLIGEVSAKRCDVVTLSERKIIINSAMINPVGNEARGEWVSLHNRGSRKVNMCNWRLVDGQGRVLVLTESVDAGGSLRLKGAAKGKIKLANSGGSMMLYDGHNCIIDHVTWSRMDIKKVEEGVAYMFEHAQ